MQLVHIPEDSECFKVMDDKAYFQMERSTHYFKFNSKREAEDWRNKRSLDNRKNKNFEMFMCTNDEGHVDFVKYYKLHTSMGIAPEEPYCLDMTYALEELGLITEPVDDQVLLDNQKKRKPIKRNKEVRRVDHGRTQRLKQLTDSCNLPSYMGELFLSEIRLSVGPSNNHLRTRAKLLGLL